jgi:hypothetical protein
MASRELKFAQSSIKLVNSAVSTEDLILQCNDNKLYFNKLEVSGSGGGGSDTLSDVVDRGNVTSNIVQFSNACNAFVITEDNSNIVFSTNVHISSSLSDASVAIGHQAGKTDQSSNAVAIGQYAGQTGQNSYSVAIGHEAGKTDQSSNAVAIGTYAGRISQKEKTIVLNATGGVLDGSSNANATYIKPIQRYTFSNVLTYDDASGELGQGVYGGSDTLSDVVDRGNVTSNIVQFSNAYHAFVITEDNSNIVFSKNVHISSSHSDASVAIGKAAGQTSQHVNSIAIGQFAGQYGQNEYSVAIGTAAGQNGQNVNSIAIGTYAGYQDQNSYSVAIGDAAGANGQNSYSVAIGKNAGANAQHPEAIAIGNAAGTENQNSYSVAIGKNAGYQNQGQYSVCIGKDAGYTTCHDNCIMLNATGAVTASAAASSFLVNPIRTWSNPAGSGNSGDLWWDGNEIFAYP